MTDDSPDTEIKEYRDNIKAMTIDLEEFADELNEQIKDAQHKTDK